MRFFIHLFNAIYSTYFKPYFLLAISFLSLSALDRGCTPVRSQLSVNNPLTEEQAKTKAVYVLHGLNCDSEHPELVNLATYLKFPSQQAFATNTYLPRRNTYCVPMPEAYSIEERLKAAREFINDTEARKKHDEVFLVGHSFGGLLAADLGTELKRSGTNIGGVVTINSPMGGISFTSNDKYSTSLIQNALNDLRSDRNALDVDSSYLKKIRSSVQESNLPILSIGSRCKLSQTAKFASLIAPVVSGVRENIKDTDITLKLSTQLAVKDWRAERDNKNIAVKKYEDRAHMNVSIPLICNKSIKLTDATSILEDTDVHDTIKKFITDPIAATANCTPAAA